MVCQVLMANMSVLPKLISMLNAIPNIVSSSFVEKFTNFKNNNKKFINKNKIFINSKGTRMAEINLKISCYHYSKTKQTKFFLS